LDSYKVPPDARSIHGRVRVTEARGERLGSRKQGPPNAKALASGLYRKLVNRGDVGLPINRARAVGLGCLQHKRANDLILMLRDQAMAARNAARNAARGILWRLVYGCVVEAHSI
jgi:hypothetical protein